MPDGLPLVAFEDGTCQFQDIGWTERTGRTPWYAFARGREEGVPVHVIGDPAQGAAGPFAVVLRFFEPIFPPTGPLATPIGDDEVFITLVDPLEGQSGPGNGQAAWDLPDGSQGYLRSRGLDRDDIESIVSVLYPRSAEHALPGFEYDTAGSQPERLTLLAEQTNDDLRADVYGIDCLVDAPQSGSLVTHVAVIADEGIAPYAAAIDRHRPAWIVRADGAVFIGGIERPFPDPPAEALASITPEEWRALWSPNSELAMMSGVGHDDPLSLQIGAVGQSVDETSPVTLARPGGQRLHLDFTDTVFARDAALVELRVDGEHLASSSIPVYSLEVEADVSGRTTIDIRVLDSAGNVVQQSGPTSLPAIAPS